MQALYALLWSVLDNDLRTLHLATYRDKHALLLDYWSCPERAPDQTYEKQTRSSCLYRACNRSTFVLVCIILANGRLYLRLTNTLFLFGSIRSVFDPRDRGCANAIAIGIPLEPRRYFPFSFNPLQVHCEWSCEIPARSPNRGELSRQAGLSSLPKGKWSLLRQQAIGCYLQQARRLPR